MAVQTATAAIGTKWAFSKVFMLVSAHPRTNNWDLGMNRDRFPGSENEVRRIFDGLNEFNAATKFTRFFL